MITNFHTDWLHYSIREIQSKILYLFIYCNKREGERRNKEGRKEAGQYHVALSFYACICTTYYLHIYNNTFTNFFFTFNNQRTMHLKYSCSYFYYSWYLLTKGRFILTWIFYGLIFFIFFVKFLMNLYFYNKN